MDFDAGFAGYRQAVEEALSQQPLLNPCPAEPTTQVGDDFGDEMVPQPLRSAMRYSLLLPGKRVRPVLLLAAYALLREEWRQALPFACGLEMIHTYSLIHDDLPAMDNDDYRRGQLTNHKVFGENMAILAGDGLLNLAYETMLSAPLTAQKPEVALPAIREIAERAGVRGMIAGQTLDVKLEGTAPSQKSVSYIHAHKTADLLTAPVTAGLMLAGADEDALRAGREFGFSLGVAFQIRDDLLDLHSDLQTLGKEAGMDAQRGKMTWPAVFGEEQAEKDARMYSDRAQAALDIFGEKAAFLQEMAARLCARSY